jgi:hypothetical protein
VKVTNPSTVFEPNTTIRIRRIVARAMIEKGTNIKNKTEKKSVGIASRMFGFSKLFLNEAAS